METENLPRDWRKAWAAVALVAASGGPPLAWARALEKRLDEHLAEVAALRPGMDKAVAEILKKLEAVDHKADRLLEDCYRRGGCK